MLNKSPTKLTVRSNFCNHSHPRIAFRLKHLKGGKSHTTNLVNFQSLLHYSEQDSGIPISSVGKHSLLLHQLINYCHSITYQFLE